MTITAVEKAREHREIESLISKAQHLENVASCTADALQSIRSRLLGMEDGDADKPQIKEADLCQISELRGALNRLEDQIQRINDYTANLETL